MHTADRQSPLSPSLFIHQSLSKSVSQSSDAADDG